MAIAKTMNVIAESDILFTNEDKSTLLLHHKERGYQGLYADIESVASTYVHDVIEKFYPYCQLPDTRGTLDWSVAACKTLGNVVTVSFSQQVYGIPLLGKGISVHFINGEQAYVFGSLFQIEPDLRPVEKELEA